jgi:hypothetical protein
MPKATSIKPTHKALKKYYAALQGYRDHQVTHEGALETAFQRLLEETGKSYGWRLVSAHGSQCVGRAFGVFHSRPERGKTPQGG